MSSLAKMNFSAFFNGIFNNFVKTTRKEIAAGSPAPLFKAMLLVGVVGYTMEYTMVGSKSQNKNKKIFALIFRISIFFFFFHHSPFSVYNYLFAILYFNRFYLSIFHT